MKAFLDSRQTEHDPKYFMSSGAIAPNPEQPKRVEILSAGAKNAGCVFAEPTDMGIGHIAKIHSPQYLTFLENIGDADRFRHIIKDGRLVDTSTPLPKEWQLPGWRVSEYSERILTKELVQSMGLNP